MGQAHKGHAEPQDQQSGGDDKIRHAHRGGDGGLRLEIGGAGEDERAAGEGSKEGADGIEGLRQGETHGGAMFGSENGDVRIGCDLERSHARADDKDRGQKQRKVYQLGCGDE